MRDPNAPNPQDMQRPPSHCAKRGPGADVQAKAAPPARLRRSETVFQIKAYLKNNKTWRLGKAPARPDATVEVGGADRGRERSRHGGWASDQAVRSCPPRTACPPEPWPQPTPASHVPAAERKCPGAHTCPSTWPTTVPVPPQPPCSPPSEHAVGAPTAPSPGAGTFSSGIQTGAPPTGPGSARCHRPPPQHTCLHARGPLAQGHVR